MKGTRLEPRGILVNGYTRMIKTADDFYPNYPNNEVKVSVLLFESHIPMLHINYCLLNVWAQMILE